MSNLWHYFDRVFIINLDFRKDKWELVVPQLKSVGIDHYERFSAIRPEFKDICKEHQKNLAARNHSDGTDETYVVGGMGCKLSHIEVIKLARERGYKKTLIFEDDIEFRQQSNRVLQAAIQQLRSFPEWDMLYFTGNHGGRFKKVSPNLVKMHGSHSTVGYAISNSIYDYVIDNALKYAYHIDLFYKDKVHPKYNCYCIMPHLVWNTPGFSDIEQGYREYRVLKRHV